MDVKYHQERAGLLALEAGGGGGRGGSGGGWGSGGRGAGRPKLSQNSAASVVSSSPSSSASSVEAPSTMVEAPSGNSSKKIKLEQPEVSTSVVNVLPSMVPLTKDGSHRSLSVDVEALQGELGAVLVGAASAPLVECHAIVVSNVSVTLSQQEFEELAQKLSNLLPQGSNSLVQIGDRFDQHLLVCGESAHLILYLAKPTFSSVPSERRGAGAPSVLPAFVYFPREESTLGSSPHVVWYAPRAMADQILKGTVVGVARCYAWHSLDVSLTCAMIQRTLRERLPKSMAVWLFVVPFVLIHPVLLPPPDACEICYRIIYGSRAPPAGAISALFQVPLHSDLQSHPGEIVSVELPFLLMRDCESLLGLPFDDRLVTEDLSLPGGRLAYLLKIPSMAKYDVGFYLVVLLQAIESSGLSAQSVKKAVSSVVRISKRAVECALLVTEALPPVVAKRLGSLFTGALITPLTKFPSEDYRVQLLSSLAGARNAQWWAHWVRALPQISPQGIPSGPVVPQISPQGILQLESELRRLGSLLAPLPVRIADLSSLVDSLGEDLSAAHGAGLDAEETMRARLSELADSVDRATTLVFEVNQKLHEREEHWTSKFEEVERRMLALEASRGPAAAVSRQDSGTLGGLRTGAPPLPPASFPRVDLQSSGGSSPVTALGRVAGGSPASSSALAAPLLLSFAMVTSPPPLHWEQPSRPVPPVFLEGMEGLSRREVDSIPIDAHLSIGWARSTSIAGESYMRVTLLLPSTQWGVSVLVPRKWEAREGAFQAEGNISDCPIVLHRQLLDCTAPLPRSEPASWACTALPLWTSMRLEHSPMSLSQELQQVCFLRGSCYPFKGTAFSVTLPLEIASAAISSGLPHLPLLHTVASLAEAAVDRLRVVVGEYTVDFSRHVQSATSLALHAKILGESLRDVDVLGLPCSIRLPAAPSMEDTSLSPYVLIHAFAEGRWRAAGSSGQNAPQIFAYTGGKKVKAPESERKAFKQLFQDIPFCHAGDWGLFTAWMDGQAVQRSTGPFTDAWLLLHLHEHDWLGNAWRDAGTEGLVLSTDQGALTLLKRTFNTKPSQNIAFSVKMATPFFPPSWPEGALEAIKIALLEAVSPAALLLKDTAPMAALLTPDPLELDYPLLLDTI